MGGRNSASGNSKPWSVTNTRVAWASTIWAISTDAALTLRSNTRNLPRIHLLAAIGQTRKRTITIRYPEYFKLLKTSPSLGKKASEKYHRPIMRIWKLRAAIGLYAKGLLVLQNCPAGYISQYV
jgi:hypothetical protein